MATSEDAKSMEQTFETGLLQELTLLELPLPIRSLPEKELAMA